EARERQRELVVREADVGEVRVDAGHHVGVDVDVQLSLLVVVRHAPTIYPWKAPSRGDGSRTHWPPRPPSSSRGRSPSPTSPTRAGSRRSTARSSRARSRGSTPCRRTTRPA